VLVLVVNVTAAAGAFAFGYLQDLLEPDWMSRAENRRKWRRSTPLHPALTGLAPGPSVELG
jgi:hypothetical protein